MYENSAAVWQQKFSKTASKHNSKGQILKLDSILKTGQHTQHTKPIWSMNH